MADAPVDAQAVKIKSPDTRGWYAWNDLMPPTPDFVHVVGEVLVPNPGVGAELTYREPQGINPAILLLDLTLHQKPGIWPQVLVWKPVNYDAVLGATKYARAVIFYDGAPLIALDVQDVHLAATTAADRPEHIAGASITNAANRRVAGAGGESPFPWIHAALPLCLSGSVVETQVDFCMDGARHALHVHSEMRVRVKGATPAIEAALGEVAGKRVLVTVCGRMRWSVEGCRYLLASFVAPAERFVSTIGM
jgi:hypothetical protein